MQLIFFLSSHIQTFLYIQQWIITEWQLIEISTYPDNLCMWEVLEFNARGIGLRRFRTRNRNWTLQSTDNNVSIVSDSQKLSYFKVNDQVARYGKNKLFHFYFVVAPRLSRATRTDITFDCRFFALLFNPDDYVIWIRSSNLEFSHIRQDVRC